MVTTADTSPESWALRAALLAAMVAALLTGCAPGAGDPGTVDAQAPVARGSSWSVTAWGSLYEIFPEIEALVAGETAVAHTHITVLDGFTPLSTGNVEILLIDSASQEQVFTATKAARAGIFQINLTPLRAGEYQLSFRIESTAGAETIRGGRVRVGTAASPGGIVRAPAPRGAISGGEPVPFLKEQQWQGSLLTDWVSHGTLARSVEGLAKARPAAGGEAWITAPVEGLVQAEPWPFVGQKVEQGEALFLLAPSVAPGRSFAQLEADLEVAQEELNAAKRRLSRLEELIEVEATSMREVEEARTRESVARARVTSATQDLAAARATRQGHRGGALLRIEAPFDGTVANVEATPGSAAGGAQRLARLVRTDVLWLAVALPPEASARLGGGIQGVVLAGSSAAAFTEEGRSLRFASDVTRLVSVAPSVDQVTGKLDALIEVAISQSSESIPLGSIWNAQVLLPTEDEGIVIPASALVDDGGQTVVFLQLGGETFVRQAVKVLARQGERVLVGGLVPGQRLVSRGGESIRRSTLMSTGAGHGHIH